MNAVAAATHELDMMLAQLDVKLTTLDDRLHNLEDCRLANPQPVPTQAWAPSAIDQKQVKLAALRAAVAEFRA